jgi:hypothetical protein
VTGECHGIVIDDRLRWIVEIVSHETDYGEDKPSSANILAQDLNFLHGDGFLEQEFSHKILDTSGGFFSPAMGGSPLLAN